MTKQELIMNLDENSFNEINERMLKTYLSNIKDVRKWPNLKWDFAGIIKPSIWRKKLQWDKWKTEWQDPSQVISYSKSFIH